MTIIDTLVTYGCTTWFPLYGQTKDLIDNSTVTVNGTLLNYTLSNRQVAGYFNGSTYINGFTSILPGQSFTLSVWFMQTASAVSGTVNTIYDSTNSGGTIYVRLNINSSNVVNFICTNGTTTITTSYGSAIENNVWYHAVVTHTTSATSILINGLNKVTGGAVTLTLASQTYETIGCYGYALTNKFTGCLKNLMVFNNVLSDTKIKKLHYLTYIGV